MVATKKQYVFRTLHANGALLGYQLGSLEGRSEGSVLGRQNTTQESNFLGFIGGKVAGGVGEFAEDAVVADNTGEAGEGSDVGRQGNVDLLDTEVGVGRGVAVSRNEHNEFPELRTN